MSALTPSARSQFLRPRHACLGEAPAFAAGGRAEDLLDRRLGAREGLDAGHGEAALHALVVDHDDLVPLLQLRQAPEDDRADVTVVDVSGQDRAARLAGPRPVAIPG